jgi:Tfp pilus assembly PilM family ATPase
VFSMRSRKPRRAGMVGLALDRGGFRLAHVTRDPDGAPRLELALDQRVEDMLALRGALAARVKELGLAGTACTAVLAPELYSLRQVDPPAVEPHELREAARWSIKDLVDFSVEDAIVDAFPSPEARGRPARLNVVAARRKPLQQLVETLEHSGLELQAIDIVELALRNAAALLPADGRGVALLHAQPPLGVLTLSCSGWLWFSRQLELAPEQLESAAEDALGDKLESGGEGERALDALLLDLQRSLDYYEHQLGQPSPAELVLTPTSVELSTLRRWLSKHLPLPIRELELPSLLRCSHDLPRAVSGVVLTAVGGALRAGAAAP